MRRTYIDNIRWMTVVLVMIYHVPYVFNNVGVPGGIGPEKCLEPMNAVLYFSYPWFMVLLFLVSGMCARYSLEKMSHKEFIKSKVDKLLIPSTLGLFIIHPITGYINITLGGVADLIPSFIRIPLYIISGSGVLWFVHLLFVFCLLLVLVRRLDKNERIYQLGAKTNMLLLLLMFFVVWGSAQILNPKYVIVYRFGIYFTVFLLGYFVFSHDEVTDRLIKYRYPLLIATGILAVMYIVVYWGKENVSIAVLKTPFTNLYAWMAVLTVLACGKQWLGFENKISTFMKRISFPLYVFHYPVLLVTGYFLYQSFLPAGMIYMISYVAEFVGAYILYEIIRRIPFVRYLSLGIQKNK